MILGGGGGGGGQNGCPGPNQLDYVVSTQNCMESRDMYVLPT